MQIFTKLEAKQQIEILVKKFDNLTPSQLKHYNEANTRKDFILPLFHALNWDVYNDQCSNEVIEEETTISGRIDYSFRINNLIQFLLEAKAIPVDLDKEQWAQQAIEYGWNKGIGWVILTDFEGLKIFNSDWRVNKPKPNLTFTYKEYLTNFDDLWLLSRESIAKGELNAEAQKWGITSKRVSVNELLAADLVEWREILTNNFSQWNDKINSRDIDEAVQRILDRLIFIRVVEDRNIEEKSLWQTYQKWEANGRKPNNFIQSLIPIFREYDRKYNSNLFAKHLCEDLNTEGTPFCRIIPQLYGEKEEGIKYRFDAINADVLGGVYEQYLGAVQRKEGSISKRKKQGIYYTPNYIVEYIVQNTLGKLLKETPGLADREKIKILDPACGSGSFLIKAFELMDENLRKDRENPALRKTRILTENIYGVDLDEQAIEIARLNLLLKALVPDQKLPLLTKHMKVGNSLIDNPKIDKKAFNWSKEFDEVFNQKNPGFDIVIGNPPYVRVDEIENRNKKYFKDFYLTSSGKYDLYYLFIEKILNLVEKNGFIGLIVPNKFCVANSAKNLRELIFSNAEEIKIISVSRLNIFKNASNYPIILLIKKGKGLKKIEVEFFENFKLFLTRNPSGYKINNNQISSLPNKILPININQTQFNLVFKLIESNQKLDNYSSISEGLRIPASKEKNIGSDLKIVKQYQFDRYTAIKKITVVEEKDLEIIIKADSKRYKNIFTEKILIAEDALRISATLDKENFIPQGGVYFLALNDKNEFDLTYLLTLLNSKLLSFVYKSLFGAMHMGGGYLRFRSEFLKYLPIKIGTKEQVSKLRNLCKENMKTKKDILAILENSDKWQELNQKELMIENQIDQIVYKLYGLTPEEIKIVERN